MNLGFCQFTLVSVLALSASAEGQTSNDTVVASPTILSSLLNVSIHRITFRTDVPPSLLWSNSTRIPTRQYLEGIRKRGHIG